jgi:Flp pilus assembly protein TadD
MTMTAPLPAAHRLRRRLLSGAALLPIAVTLALAGCASPKTVDPATTASIARPVTEEDFAKATSYWGDRYAADPKNHDVDLNYAAALRRTGRTDQAVAVLQKAAIYFPDDRDVLAAYGKALAANGDLERALDAVRRAQTPDRPDWQLISAEAAILDQMGTHDQARRLYAKALELAPNEASILSNLGMSYVLTGDLAQAEKILRQAAAMPGADSRVRQNLALAVGLSGRFDEAEKIASAELSPEQAATNVAYLKSMLTQQNSWEQLKTQQVASTR